MTGHRLLEVVSWFYVPLGLGVGFCLLWLIGRWEPESDRLRVVKWMLWIGVWLVGLPAIGAGLACKGSLAHWREYFRNLLLNWLTG